MLAMVDRENCGYHAWVLAFTDHALQRALQRGPPGLDLTALAWEAVESARRISMPFLLSRLTPDRFRVTAGKGAFACSTSLIDTRGHEMPVVQARTWLAADQMSEIQEAEIVEDGQPGERFDDAYELFRQQWTMPGLIEPRTKLGFR
jgi:hypothetical protein